MLVLSLLLAGASAVQAGGMVEKSQAGLAVHRVLSNGGDEMTAAVVADIAAWGAAERWEVGSADAGMLSAGQKLSTQTFVSLPVSPFPSLVPLGSKD